MIIKLGPSFLLAPSAHSRLESMFASSPPTYEPSQWLLQNVTECSVCQLHFDSVQHKSIGSGVLRLMDDSPMKLVKCVGCVERDKKEIVQERKPT